MCENQLDNNNYINNDQHRKFLLQSKIRKKLNVSQYNIII